MSEFHLQEEALGKAYDSKQMRRLLKYLRPYKSLVVISASALFFGSGTQIALIALVQIALDDYVMVGDLGGLTMIAGIYLAITIARFGAEYLQFYTTAKMGQETLHDIRMEVFAKLQRMDSKYFDKNPVGRLVTRVTNDVNTLNELFSSGVINVIGDIIMLVAFVSMMLYYDWLLSLAVFAVLPFLVVTTLIFRNKVRTVFRDLRVTIAQINAFVNEHLSGIAVVKLFAREKAIKEKFDTLNRRAMDQNLKQVFYYAVFFPVVELIGAVSLAALIVVGGMQITAGLLTFGELTAFILLVERFFRPIRDLSEKYNIMQASMASSERIFQLLDAKLDRAGLTPTVTIPRSAASSASPSTTPALSLKGEVEFKNVSFAYNEPEYVLKNISFKANPGENIAIVGATGAGKTSLISLLFRFYDFQSGQILIDNRDIREYDIFSLRSRIALAPQDVQIFSGNLAYNIRLGDNSISDEQVLAAAKDVGLDQALGDDFDLGMEIQERGATLSTGQKQLLSFARALAFDPDILTLDEATSSVDTATERLIQNALERIMKGRTSFVVAHRLSTIEKADRILVFHQGELRETGTHEELLAIGGVYQKLYRLQYQPRNIERSARSAVV
ncbi:MAG: ABC transporter ATP-binding protein [candidate division Zixibacteria bacterium]|nr:ABC transporter ATP-binding protein [candidate division Zixibacteria bacterium]